MWWGMGRIRTCLPDQAVNAVHGDDSQRGGLLFPLASPSPLTGLFSRLNSTQEAFLTTLRDMSPDLCVTAAYGNMLPQAFLDIPRLGTLNIHPSLLPK